MKFTIKKILLAIFGVVLVIIIFGQWFFGGVISAGDLNYFFPKTLTSLSLLPYAWTWNLNSGIGGNGVPFLGSQYNTSLLYLFSSLHLQWNIVERLSEIFPFLFLSIIGSYFVYLFNGKKSFLLTFIIYSLNTYILMVVGGGQLLVGTAYAMSPVVIVVFSRLLNLKSPGRKAMMLFSLLFGLLLSFEMMIDLRWTYMVIFVCGVYFLIHFISNWDKDKFLLFLQYIPVMLFVFLGINMFWLFPFTYVHDNPLQQLGSAYSTTGAVQYFSFAKFEDALGLLHPNWPENIFGLTHFMRPEFLIFPILAFTSLLFVGRESKERKTTILTFVLIGLIGAFLAKGANDPFGVIYLWMFQHVPGFELFRDPTKWYTLVAISYAVLIPYSVFKIFQWIKMQNKLAHYNLQNIFLILVFCALLFPIRPALLGQLGGTFRSTSVPRDYVRFEKFLSSDARFSRTMWVPNLERFGFTSATHPGISAEGYFNKTSLLKTINDINNSSTLHRLQNLSVAYIIVPYDAQGELFLKDRKYDNAQYLSTISRLQKIPWLKRINGFGKIAVFAVPNVKGHFYMLPTTGLGKITFKEINPVSYQVSVANLQKGERLVFSESYDKHWEAFFPNHKVISEKYNGLNSFILPEGGTYTLKAYYAVQDLVNVGLVISVISLFLAVFGILILRTKK